MRDFSSKGSVGDVQEVVGVDVVRHWIVGLREVRGDTPTPCSQSRLAYVFVLLIIWDGRRGEPG